jgi:hypothetical protein
MRGRAARPTAQLVAVRALLGLRHQTRGCGGGRDLGERPSPVGNARAPKLWVATSGDVESTATRKPRKAGGPCRRHGYELARGSSAPRPGELDSGPGGVEHPRAEPPTRVVATEPLNRACLADGRVDLPPARGGATALATSGASDSGEAGRDPREVLSAPGRVVPVVLFAGLLCPTGLLSSFRDLFPYGAKRYVRACRFWP